MQCTIIIYRQLIKPLKGWRVQTFENYTNEIHKAKDIISRLYSGIACYNSVQNQSINLSFFLSQLLSKNVEVGP